MALSRQDRVYEHPLTSFEPNVPVGWSRWLALWGLPAAAVPASATSPATVLDLVVSLTPHPDATCLSNAATCSSLRV